MTEELFREDATLAECDATIVAIDERGVQLDRTVFYPQGGGQAGDRGELIFEDGPRLAIADTRKGQAVGEILHLPAPGQEAEAARHAGRAVDSLGYEAHESMALAVLGAIADEVAERFGVERLAIVHRTGDVPLGEVSIAVVAVAPHRDSAFRAARYGIDETKARAPIWKAERFADGHVWIGEPAREAPRS